MLWVLLGVGIAAAEVPVGEVDDSTSSALWSGGSRDHIFGIVGLESEVKAIGRNIANVHLISAELDWGNFFTTPAKGPRHAETTSFSHSSLTVTRERVLDAELLHSVTSLEDPSIYDLSDPKERGRLCARLPGERSSALALHTWTPNATHHGENDLARRGDNPSILMAEDGTSRTAMIALQPGESATIVQIRNPRARQRVVRRLRVDRGQRTLTLTEGTATSRVCLNY